MERLIADRKKAIEEMRKLLENAKNENRALNDQEKEVYSKFEKHAEELKQAIEAEKRLLEMEKELRDFKLPIVSDAKPGKKEFRDLLEALVKEKRAITISGTGATQVISEIVRELVKNNTLLSRYRTFYGPNASTVIPILSPLPATAGPLAEGGSLTADTQAALAAKTLQPKAYASLLPVSAETLLMSGANIEAALPEAFADVFRDAMMAGSITGSGTSGAMLGMFASSALSNSVSCGASGAPKLADLLNLALKIKDLTETGMIVLNGTFLAGMLAESGSSLDAIKNEIMIRGSVLGIPIYPTGHAPTTITAGSIVAVGMDPRNYALGIAQEVTIRPIETTGDTYTYFKAMMFFNGTTIVPKNGYKLVTV
ncbi:TPA: phage major capsid protein [Candidatus Poribacteria bacterium]|nr:phage major capsid protein [Candidatus Poribacteria bacterium]